MIEFTKESFFKKCRDAVISSNLNSVRHRLKIARVADKTEGDKKATLSVYPDIQRSNDALNCLCIKIITNDLQCINELVNIIKIDGRLNPCLSINNAVNAGYRTNDLHLALANVNKKYTLKLYDDRDTWEPILSKIRAMIDAL